MPYCLCASIHLVLIVHPTTKTYTLSLHDALPISSALIAHQLDVRSDLERQAVLLALEAIGLDCVRSLVLAVVDDMHRSEEHTSELKSLRHLVCRLLLEKKR